MSRDDLGVELRLVVSSGEEGYHLVLTQGEVDSVRRVSTHTNGHTRAVD